VQLSRAVSLIQHSIAVQENVWADLGCGDGLFTNALSQLLPEKSSIYAVDKNKRALNEVSVKHGIQLKKFILDFEHDHLPFENVSGILMANSFHFVKDKNGFIHKVLNCLVADGYFIMVEYDTDKSNLWVPYPISFNNLKQFFDAYSYTTQKLHETPSRYHGIIYSALINKRD
jgi:trans-aconitate methyltransferase